MLFKFKRTAQETADRQKEKLKLTINLPNEEKSSPIQLFLACEDEVVSWTIDIFTITSNYVFIV